MVSTDYSTISYEKASDRVYIEFDRPDSRNALTVELYDELSAAMHRADGDEDVMSIIVSGAGSAFSAGGDFEEMLPEVLAGDGHVPSRGIADDRIGDAMLKHHLVRTPIIAAVNGPAMGGGMEFMLATDIRVASDEAVFQLPEPRLGLPHGGGSNPRLPRQIPYCRAMEILLTGDSLTPEEAESVGLVNEVVPHDELPAAADRYADLIAENSRLAVRTIKEIVVRSLNEPLEQAFYSEREYARKVYESDEARRRLEAMRAE